MRLEPMALRRRLAVIADGDGQEMILDIGLLDARRRAQEGAGFELVGSAEAGFEEHPLRADNPLHVPGQPGVERDRLQAGLLEIEFHMVLQVGADARPVVFHLYAHLLQMLPGADAGEHQQFRELKEDAETITSRFALTISILPPRSISTPVARPFSITTLRAKQRISSTFGRFSAGFR